MFADEGAAVFDADKVVSVLYRSVAVAPIEAAFPGTTSGGMVDRAKLAAVVTKDPASLATVEAIVHPLVAVAEAKFLSEAARSGRHVTVLDIPLLFETGAEARVDAVVVVSTTPAIQRERVRLRGTMGEAHLAALIARQVPDAERRRRAHFVIDTGRPLEATRDDVRAVLRAFAATAVAR
jgi:dephospho-CoA kinase